MSVAVKKLIDGENKIVGHVPMQISPFLLEKVDPSLELWMVCSI